MNIDPLSTALKEIVETRAMVESLIVSSERFDYSKAKLALRELTKKSQALAKTKAKFETLLKEREPNIRVIDFRANRLAAQKS
jgi:hypothetical protein